MHVSAHIIQHILIPYHKHTHTCVYIPIQHIFTPHQKHTHKHARTYKHTCVCTDTYQYNIYHSTNTQKHMCVHIPMQHILISHHTEHTHMCTHNNTLPRPHTHICVHKSKQYNTILLPYHIEHTHIHTCTYNSSLNKIRFD